MDNASLEKVLENPKHPVVMIIGGGKYDKAILVDKLFRHADTVLVGGVLPHKIKSYCRDTDGKMCIVAAHVNRSGQDITPDSARNFAEVIESAKTIVWNGPMGVFEIPKFALGTKRIAQAIARSKAVTVLGGGDTESVIGQYNLNGQFTHVSTGGGASLEFLAGHELPAIKDLIKK